MIETIGPMNVTDASLVAESLGGNREAFSLIVARYQTLLCALAYSATGNVALSEDLAQEAFVAAWKQLPRLREPQKLRSWLCCIARNLTFDALKRQGREPSHAAETLETIYQISAPEPLPNDLAMSKEEEAILWRSIQRIPELYREPLVLFYREHQSIEAVARNLDLSEDAVKQRLARGRKLLHEEVLAFVEGALERTNPGKLFTLGVLAAVPVLTQSARAATLGATTAKGSATVKAAGFMGLFSAIFAPILIFFGNYATYRKALANAHSDEEREYLRSQFRRVVLVMLAFFIPCAEAIVWLHRGQEGWGPIGVELLTGLVILYLLTLGVFAIANEGRRKAYYSKLVAENYQGNLPAPTWEYCSRTKLFGLPLVHIRVGDRFDILRKPVIAWIASGHCAIGGLFALGGLAVAPLSMGFMAMGLFSLGGLSLGLFPAGGVALGMSAYGGLAIGWHAWGCFAIAWKAASGNVALAYEVAMGKFARAGQVNNGMAAWTIRSIPFFQWVRFLNQHWLWINLVWVTPLLLQWQVMARRRRK